MNKKKKIPGKKKEKEMPRYQLRNKSGKMNNSKLQQPVNQDLKSIHDLPVINPNAP